MTYRITLTPGHVEIATRTQTMAEVDEVLRVLNVAKLHLETEARANPYVWINPFEHHANPETDHD